jgi:hypothetical protein
MDKITKSVGKEIAGVTLLDNRLRFVFTDKTEMYVVDDGQSCCEMRYMTTDDELDSFIGAKLLGLETKDAPYAKATCEDDTHEVQFLEIQTSKGALTMANHNEHNGYYGGFSVTVEEV